MSLWTYEKIEKTEEFVVLRIDDTEKMDEKEEIIIVKDEETAKQLEQIFAAMDDKCYQEKAVLQIEIKAAGKLVEFYQTLITNIVEDKLDNIDNLYAMKTMLKEMATMLEDLIPQIESMKDNMPPSSNQLSD